MEENTNKSQNDEKRLELHSEGIRHLDEARKWSMFLAVLGFIGIGFLVIAAFFVGAIFSFVGDDTIPGGLGVGMTILYLLIGVVYFFPVYYLLQFSIKSKKAVTESSSSNFGEAIGNLKSHYKFIGIISIIMMVIYPIIIVVVIAGGLISSL